MKIHLIPIVVFCFYCLCLPNFLESSVGAAVVFYRTNHLTCEIVSSPRGAHATPPSCPSRLYTRPLSLTLLPFLISSLAFPKSACDVWQCVFPCHIWLGPCRFLSVLSPLPAGCLFPVPKTLRPYTWARHWDSLSGEGAGRSAVQGLP